MRQIKKKVVVGLKSLEKNENIDYLLQQYSRYELSFMV